MEHYHITFRFGKDRQGDQERGNAIDQIVTDLLEQSGAQHQHTYPIPPSFNELLKGLLSTPADIITYEVSGEGIIEITKTYPLDAYAKAVILQGFDSDSEVLMNWTSRLTNLGFKREPSPEEKLEPLIEDYMQIPGFDRELAEAQARSMLGLEKKY